MYKIIVTDTFSKEFRKRKKDGNFCKALEGKIKKLKENPEFVGKYLAGVLKGKKSTRILDKFRLVFRVDVDNSVVYLLGVDHRKYSYKNF